MAKQSQNIWTGTRLLRKSKAYATVYKQVGTAVGTSAWKGSRALCEKHVGMELQIKRQAAKSRDTNRDNTSEVWPYISGMKEERHRCSQQTKAPWPKAKGNDLQMTF